MYFGILKRGLGQYWRRIQGANNEIMANSEQLSSRQACQNAIAVVKGGATGGRIVDSTGE